MPRVDIVFSQRGARKIARDTSAIGRSAKETNTAVAFLKRGLATLGVGVVVRQFVQLSDTFTAASNRLKVLSGSTEIANRQFAQLLEISNRTRTPLETNVQLYQKLSLAQNELGASTQELLSFTEQIGQLLAIQGGSSESARGALLQLSQAMGSSIVRAEEFNSILEGAFPIAQAAARGLDRAGGSVARLRALVIAGEVSNTEFFRAIQSEADATAQTFSATGSTIGQATTILKNNLIAIVGEFNKTTGAASGFVAIINKAGDVAKFLSKNLSTVIPLAEGLAAAFATIVATKILAFFVAYIVKSSAATIATAAFEATVALATGQLKLFGLSLVKAGRAMLAFVGLNPFTAVIAGVALAIGALVSFRNETFKVGDQTVTIGALAEEAFDRIGPAIEGAQAFVVDFFNQFGVSLPTFREVVNNIIAGFKTVGDVVVIIVRGITDRLAQLATSAGAIFSALPDAIRAGITGGVSAGADVLRTAFENSLVEIPEIGSEIGRVAAENFNRDFVEEIETGLAASDFIRSASARVRGGGDDAAGGGEGAPIAPPTITDTGATEKQRESFQGLLESLKPLAGLTREYTESQNILNEAFNTGLITGEEFQELYGLVNQRLVESIENLKDFSDPQTLAQFAETAKVSLQGVIETMGDVEASFSGLFTKGINGATDAIIEFATTGKANFKEFASSVVQEITRVIIKLLILKAIEAGLNAVSGQTAGTAASAVGSTVAGAASDGIVSSAGGGRANGGLVRRGEAIPVGERGPELFVPPTTGQVVSNQNLAQQQEPPQVNVNITNVSDPKEVTNVLDTSEGEQAIMNVLSRNTGRLKQLAS